MTAPLLDGRVFQLAFVVRDLEEALGRPAEFTCAARFLRPDRVWERPA